MLRKHETSIVPCTLKTGGKTPGSQSPILGDIVFRRCCWECMWV